MGKSIIVNSCTWTYLLNLSMTKHGSAESESPQEYPCSCLRLGFHQVQVLVL